MGGLLLADSLYTTLIQVGEGGPRNGAGSLIPGSKRVARWSATPPSWTFNGRNPERLPANETGGASAVRTANPQEKGREKPLLPQ